jgi:hypothetical protein
MPQLSVVPASGAPRLKSHTRLARVENANGGDPHTVGGVGKRSDGGLETGLAFEAADGEDRRPRVPAQPGRLFRRPRPGLSLGNPPLPRGQRRPDDLRAL